MTFPVHRPRRLRENASLREIVRETQVKASDLVMPMFVREGQQEKRAIQTMPGIFQLSPDLALREAEQIAKLGVRAVLLFGISDQKDASASYASKEDSVVAQSLRLIKKEIPELLLIADVCLCDYTDHGHCGLIVDRNDQPSIDNDSSLEVLSKISGAYARAGADIIAPSDMMDGRIQIIRDELDAAGFKHLPILSYAAKYASSFYGPFREALNSKPQFGDRKGYQMDPGNLKEAFREVELDLQEGADIIMVKPALPYLDVLYALSQKVNVPLAAYQVSGEYAAIKFAAQAKAFDEVQAVLESWTCIKRAGAQIIVSYFARDFAKYL